MNIVKDESELPFPATRLWQYFVRSMCDPTVLIEGHDGAVYQREDGLRWQYPAYERDASLDDRGIAEWDKLKGRGAWFDDATYPYKVKAVA